MALPDLLSAVRQLVLGQVVLPGDERDRSKTLEQSFPGLTPREVETLKRVDPERISIYTGTIISGETNTLARHFPITFALLERHWNSAYAEKFEPERFVKEMQVKHPWRGYTTDLLCSSLRDAIEEDLNEVVTLAPALPEISRLEHEMLKVARADAGRGETRQVSTVADLERYTVVELLSIPFSLVPGAALDSFDHDCVEYRLEFIKNDRSLPATEPARRKIYAVCARSHELTASWMYLAEPVHNFLIHCPAGRHQPLSDLAEASVAAHPELSLETEQFRSFLTLVLNLSDLGAIEIALPASPA